MMLSSLTWNELKLRRGEGNWWENRCGGSVKTCHCDITDILEKPGGACRIRWSSVGFRGNLITRTVCVSVCCPCEWSVWVGFDSSGILVVSSVKWQDFLCSLNGCDWISPCLLRWWWETYTLLRLCAAWLKHFSRKYPKRPLFKIETSSLDKRMNCLNSPLLPSHSLLICK